jgi:hypothetical protein
LPIDRIIGQVALHVREVNIRVVAEALDLRPCPVAQGDSEVCFFVLQLADLVRVPAGLVGQLLLELLPRLDRLAALLLFGLDLAFELGHASLQLRDGFCKVKEKVVNDNAIKEESHREDPARLLSSQPESRGLHPAGALARPR